MSDETVSTSNQNTTMYVLIAVAVLLAGIVGYLLWQQNSALPEAQPGAAAPAGTNPADATQGGATGTEGGAQSAPGQMPPAQNAEAPAVDPGTAIKLPEGTTPEQWVDEYNKATESGDFQTAVKHLPADKQAQTTPESLKEQLAGYGIKAQTITKATEEGDQASVVVDQVTEGFGTFETTWTFVKTDGAWVVANKAVTGMK